MTKKLWKTTIEIWTDEDPSNYSIVRLAEEATDGCAFCDRQNTEVITDQNLFPETEFFNTSALEDYAEEN
jgi:hypothetical protein